jgi:DNA topoisomerase-1
MAKKSSSGKALVIVESPAKAKTIGRFLGSDYVIEASIGHVRDLPEGKKQVPAEYQDEDWAYLGVNIHKDFEPIYIVSPEKRDQVKKLKDLVKDAKELYLATDEDREGEAISWHLNELLKPKVPVHRMVFHEITRDAIRHALANPRKIDGDLVKAQETRRILDRLYGFDVSNLLWRKLGGIAKSAGRVQSVAVRLVVERERERIAFVSASYWDLLGTFAKRGDKGEFNADLVRLDERRTPSAKDFDPASGKLKQPDGILLLDERGAEALKGRLAGAQFKVASLEERPYTSKPYPPFTTSTLQQECNRKMRFTARRTMQIAQSLYQNGYITYMRTDSIALSDEAIRAARNLVETQYGKEYLPAERRVYTSKVKNAQEAHEAIRPAGTTFRLPEEVRSELSDDEFRVYDLVWKRTVASEMEDARGRRITIAIEAATPQGETAVFQVGGKVIDFPGYLRAYVEGSDDPEAELADQEAILPDVQVGELLDCRKLEPKGHTTLPPARYSEATLTRTLEAMGIGRPSTYATIIDTIQSRNYVVKRGNALVPTWTAMAVVKLMEQHLTDLVDYQFTAGLEDDLDAISRGEAGHTDYLHLFYFGDKKDEQEGLKQKIERKLGEIDVREVCTFPIGTPEDDGDGEIVLRVGKYGPYLQQGDRRGSVPEDLAPDEVTVAKAVELLAQAQQADEPLGICPDTHKPVYLKTGRFGPYVQRGTAEDKEKPQNASLLPNMKPEDVDLATALKLLALPREVGQHPQNGEKIVALNGRFGPYIKCGEETRSLPADISPLDVTLEQAVELLAQPKTRGRRTSTPRAPLKELGDSPVTGKKVQLLDGRYGPYVADGETNASLPKGSSTEDVTLAQAIELLANRKAQGGGKKGKRGAPRKKAAAKKTAKGAKKKAANRKGA